MNAPSLSVIVIGHTRKDFILDALRSVNFQSLERNQYEVICVKNFTDNRMDEEIRKYTDLMITSKDYKYGEKAFDAVAASKGEILCFLDDDDLFSYNKLNIVRECFTGNRRIDYYHNGRTSGLSDFKAMDSQISFPGNSSTSIDLRSSKHDNVVSFIQGYPDFNSSSISISKKILDGKLEFLKQMIMHPDTFFLFCALEGDGVLIDDPSVMTFYRIHQSTTNNFEQSLPDFYATKLNYYSRTEPDWSTILSMLKKPTNKFLCGCDTLHNRLLRELYDQNSKRAYLFQITLKFSKCIHSRNTKNTFALLMLGFAIAFFPRLGRLLFFLFNTRLTPLF